MIRFLCYCFPAALFCCCLPACADVISPGVEDARQRLQNNPETYDRVDDFCKGKKRGEACTIPGSLFAGGGEGVCTTAINDSAQSIDMSCTRNGEVSIDRKLPEGGFVYDPDLCRLGEDKDTGEKFNCRPVVPTPADQFCKGKKTGSRCTVEFSYQGKIRRDEGICKNVTETSRFYHWGHREATREVIRCEPQQAVSHTYTPANWRQKLFQ